MNKQELLKHHRRKKRMLLGIFGIALLILGSMTTWWAVPWIGFLAWLAHEAWFSDHFFYSAQSDYRYRLQHCSAIDLSLHGDKLTTTEEIPCGETWILELGIQSDWRSLFLDPYVEIQGIRFDFEHAARGKRYLNIGNHAEVLSTEGLSFRAKYCRLSAPIRLSVFDNPEFSQRRLMIVAPHADDAELAAFNLYRKTNEVLIVTVTRGEIEADHYTRLGLTVSQAAKLKGRLRSWDSIAIPLWGGRTQEDCLQLGYFCMQLQSMKNAPDSAFGSLVSTETDTRNARRWNRLALPSDHSGQPTWGNLIADLAALIEEFKPEVILTPHPQRDPHPDHVASTQAVQEVVRQGQWKPDSFLFYTNHLHDNDRWPMGPAGAGITLPPAFDDNGPEAFWSLPTDEEGRIDKAMALAMQHDLTPRQPLKKRLRRWLQTHLADRRWPSTGENEFFRKAVRSHELFYVRKTDEFLSQSIQKK